MLCRDVTQFPLAEWFDAGIRHVSTVLLICVSCRYIVVGDHAGHVKFFDQSLKLIYWFVQFLLSSLPGAVCGVFARVDILCTRFLCQVAGKLFCCCCQNGLQRLGILILVPHQQK